MKVQFTLTVSEGKALIAKAISALPEVKRALQEGKILLKGGTTVSVVAEELAGIPLRISGRITPRGTLSARRRVTAAHTLLLDKGVPRNVDDILEEVVLAMEPGDVAICGANLIDNAGQAAIMAGSPLGGPPGRVLAALEAEGITTIIAAGLEKLGPEPINTAISAASRKGLTHSMGMAVGLIPLPGRLITELTALTILGRVRPTVIGRGGIAGAEGSCTFLIEGEEEEVTKIWDLVLSLKNRETSGERESMETCEHGGPNCALHLGCIYRGNLNAGKGGKKK